MLSLGSVFGNTIPYTTNHGNPPGNYGLYTWLFFHWAHLKKANQDMSNALPRSVLGNTISYNTNHG